MNPTTGTVGTALNISYYTIYTMCIYFLFKYTIKMLCTALNRLNENI